jgi:surfeit locus 1 family protein
MRAVKAGLLAVAALAGAAATFSLGMWQWGRAQQKLDLQAAIETRRAMPPVDAAALQAAAGGAQDLVHRQIVLRGRWEARHTVFLDNRQLGGRQGFYVVTPLRLAGGAPRDAVLVQRGWAPRDFNDRTRLPAIDTPAGEVVLRGRLAPPPAKLYEFQAGEAGAIRQNLDLAQFRAETGLELAPYSVQQLGPPSEGLVRDWPQPALGAGKNYGYAFQWWALSALIAILYVWFQFVAPRRARRA